MNLNPWLSILPKKTTRKAITTTTNSEMISILGVS